MPSITQLREAITIAEKIQSLEAELSIIIIGGSPVHSTPAPSLSVLSKRRGKRIMSPEGKARIAAAQRARWANRKGTSTPAASKPSKTPGKRIVSAESRAKMTAAQHARWARNNPSAPAKAPKKKGGLSPEGRARIVAALKARHAARRKAMGM